MIDKCNIILDWINENTNNGDIKNYNYIYFKNNKEVVKCTKEMVLLRLNRNDLYDKLDIVVDISNGIEENKSKTYYKVRYDLFKFDDNPIYLEKLNYDYFKKSKFRLYKKFLKKYEAQHTNFRIYKKSENKFYEKKLKFYESKYTQIYEIIDSIEHNLYFFILTSDFDYYLIYSPNNFDTNDNYKMKLMKSRMSYELGNSFKIELLDENGNYNCKNCIGCKFCINCIDCTNCRNCKDCKKCKYCEDCKNCNGCNNCNECTNCTNCTNCIECDNSNYLKDTTYCDNQF